MIVFKFKGHLVKLARVEYGIALGESIMVPSWNWKITQGDNLNIDFDLTLFSKWKW